MMFGKTGCKALLPDSGVNERIILKRYLKIQGAKVAGKIYLPRDRHT
jgi:hypothetical protein